MKPQTIVDLSAENLVTIVADRTYNAIAHAWTQESSGEASSERFNEPHIVITGGRTGLAIAKALDLALHRGTATNPSFASKRVHIWFSDERFVEGDSEDRSDSILIAGFTRSTAQCIFHRVALPTECSLEEAAARYAAELDAHLGELPRDADKASADGSTSSDSAAHSSGHSSVHSNFAVTILSMGEDGHIASLFPGDSRALNSSLSAVAVDNSPKPPAQRVSIGVARLAASSAIYIFAVGDSKREPLREILDETNTGPISVLRGKFAGNQLFMVTDIRL